LNDKSLINITQTYYTYRLKIQVYKSFNNIMLYRNIIKLYYHKMFVMTIYDNHRCHVSNILFHLLIYNKVSLVTVLIFLYLMTSIRKLNNFTRD